MTIFSSGQSVRIVFFVFLLSCVCSLAAQDAPAGTAVQDAVAIQDEAAILLEDPAAAPGDAAAVANSDSTVWVLLRIVLVLAIVCAGIYGVVYFLKKTTRINAGNDPYLKNVASLSLSPNKSVRVITVGSQAFVLGVTDQSISLISEISDRELIDAMNLEADRNSSMPAGNFAAVLKSFLPVKPTEVASSAPVSTLSGDSVSALATTDFLKKQRERLKNGSPE